MMLSVDSCWIFMDGKGKVIAIVLILLIEALCEENSSHYVYLQQSELQIFNLLSSQLQGLNSFLFQKSLYIMFWLKNNRCNDFMGIHEKTQHLLWVDKCWANYMNMFISHLNKCWKKS